MERLNIKYINEINAFHSWVQINELPASAVLLWYSLMHFCNRTGWKKQFNIAMSQLEADTHLTRPTIQRARKNLENAGLIKVINRRGRQSAVYIIQPFAAQYESQSEPQNGFAAQYESQSERIPRLKTIYKTKDAGAAAALKQEVLEYYQKKIHPFKNLTEREMLDSLIDDYGSDYCRKAIDRAVYRKRRTLKYITGILQRWEQDGFDNPDGSSVRQDVPEEVRNIPF